VCGHRCAAGTRLAGGACDVSDAANALSLGLYAMYLTQFLAFYVQAYLTRGAARPAASKADRANRNSVTSVMAGDVAAGKSD